MVVGWMFSRGSPVRSRSSEVLRHREVRARGAFFGYVLLFAGLDIASRKRVGVIVMFFFCAVMFWGGFEQQGTTFNPFAYDYTDRSAFGSWFAEGVHPGVVVPVRESNVHLPVRARSSRGCGCGWRAQSRPVGARKMGLGRVLLGVGFLVMYCGRPSWWFPSAARSVPRAAARLSVPHLRRAVPVAGASCRTSPKLAPPKFVGSMMGIWFLGTAIGNRSRGSWAATWAKRRSTDMPGRSSRKMTLIGAGAGIFILLISRGLRQAGSETGNEDQLLCARCRRAADPRRTHRLPRPEPTPPPKIDAPVFVEEVNKELVGQLREINAAGWTQSTDAKWTSIRVRSTTSRATPPIRLFPVLHPAVPVPQGAVRLVRIQGPAQRVLDLRQQARRARSMPP